MGIKKFSVCFPQQGIIFRKVSIWFLTAVVIIAIGIIVKPQPPQLYYNIGDTTLIWEEDDDGITVVGSGGGLEFLYDIVEEEDTTTTTTTPTPTNIEKGGLIEKVTYKKQSGQQFLNLAGGGQLRNSTEESMTDIRSWIKAGLPFEIEANNSKQVLIMHTHTTESYEPYSREYYEKNYSSRSLNEKENMTAVGEAIAEELTKAGIGVIHEKTVHDYPSYNGSYDRSRETVKKVLSKNPGIKIVLDIHRDAIQRESGVRIAPIANIDGRDAAQIMIISGRDVENYQKNLAFGSKLQEYIESSYSGLTRPLYFAHKKYNQDLTTGSLLIEVGGHGNSLDQAIYSGELIGKSLSRLIKESSK